MAAKMRIVDFVFIVEPDAPASQTSKKLLWMVKSQLFVLHVSDDVASIIVS